MIYEVTDEIWKTIADNAQIMGSEYGDTPHDNALRLGVLVDRHRLPKSWETIHAWQQQRKR